MAITVGNNANSGTQGAVASYSYNHTCNTGSNTCLVVVVVGDSSVISTVKYATVTMTQGANLLSVTSYATIFYLVAPATGTNSVLVTMTSATGKSAAASVDFFGVDQVAPKDSSGTVTAVNVSATASCTVVNANAYIVAGLMISNPSLTLTLTGTNTPTSIMDIDDAGIGEHVAAQYNGPNATGAHASTWTLSGTRLWVEAAMALKPSYTYQQLESIYQPVVEPRKGVLI